MGKEPVQSEMHKASVVGPPIRRVELKIDSHPANLRPVRKALEEFSTLAELGQDAADGIGLAVNEALANVMRHGYGGATDRPIQIAAELRTGEVRVLIRDWGPTFDPAVLPGGVHDPLKPGGLGLMCIRGIMDEVTYERLSDGMLLTMVKRKPEIKAGR